MVNVGKYTSPMDPMGHVCYSGRTATKVAGAEDERRVWCLAKTTPQKTNMTMENTNHLKVYLLY